MLGLHGSSMQAGPGCPPHDLGRTGPNAARAQTGPMRRALGSSVVEQAPPTRWFAGSRVRPGLLSNFAGLGLGLRRSDPLERSAAFLGWRQRIIASFDRVPPRVRHLAAARPALLVLSRPGWRLARLLQSIRHLPISPRWIFLSAFGAGTDPDEQPPSAPRACIQISGFRMNGRGSKRIAGVAASEDAAALERAHASDVLLSTKLA